MKLPNAERALVDGRKVREYLLSRSHPIGRFKAAFFARAGFQAKNWDELSAALRDLARQGEAVLDDADEHGQRYLVSGTKDRLESNWRSPRVDSSWARGPAAAGDRFPEVAMTYKTLDTVVLVRDLPEYGLRAGDLGAVVATYPPDSLEVEFVTASGRTTALVKLTSSDVRAISDSDLVAVRSLTSTV